MLRKTIVSILALAFVTVGMVALDRGATAQSKEGIKIGTLSCNVSSGWGFVFGSSKSLNCAFTPDGKKNTERYTGTIDKFGIDIGYSTAGVILWAVFAPTRNVDQGALAGKYIGATAELTIAVGLGANVLVGGGNSVALQPLSVSGQKGLNVAAGIAAVELKLAR